MVLATWVTRQLLFNGVVAGLSTALVAVGVVLTFRSTRVINFAVGNMGLPAASIMALLTINYDVGFWLALVVAWSAGRCSRQPSSSLSSDASSAPPG
jgi:branched-subunit amino acid ABC-type transport system permease component